MKNEGIEKWSKQNYIIYPLLFAVVIVVGLFIVKWSPYYSKAFVAASSHSIGSSIINDSSGAPPAVSWNAAVGFAAAYFQAVWKAVVLGLLAGSLVQVLIPQRWVTSFFGKDDVSSTLRASAVAVPSMMCTCCAAPVAAGLRERSASVPAALAFFMTNPVLNPATLVFMGFVLSWEMAFFRLVVGAIMIGLVAWGASRLAKKEMPLTSVETREVDVDGTKGSWLSRWLKALWQLILDTIPAYLVAVFVLGAVRIWLFPTAGIEWGNSILLIIGLSLAGTLFVVPTAAEIPIVQTLLLAGMSVGPAATLLITLPAISLPSLLIVKNVFPKKVLFFTYFAVVITGIVAGVVGSVVL